MDDYSSLAHRIAGGVADVRGCLILSRDGLILGSFPEDESVVKPSWLRFAALGEPERSFVEFAGEVWAYLRRGPYAAFAIAGLGVRPGLLIDQLEQVLMAAEEARTRRETLKVPESPASLSGKPRTSLHPPPAVGPLEPTVAGADQRPWSRGTKADDAKSDGSAPPTEPVPSGGKPMGVSAGSSSGTGAATPDAGTSDEARSKAGGKQDAGPPAPEGRSDGKGSGPKPEPDREGTGPAEHKKRKKDEDRAAAPSRAEPTPSPDGGKPSGGGREGLTLELEPEAEVDRVLLAKEFSGLLQVEAADDEAQS